MLKAIGKYIDTLPLKRLLSVEETRADTALIEVDRYYNHHDLSLFTFIMRGVTESGTETQTELSKTLTEDGNFLHLTWNISSLFTTAPGNLFLDLTAYYYIHPDMAETAPPDFVMRYQLPAIEVRDVPRGTSEATDGDNYTAFWTQVRTALAEHTAQIQQLQEHPIEVMTQAEYDALENPSADTVYILTE